MLGGTLFGRQEIQEILNWLALASAFFDKGLPGLAQLTVGLFDGELGLSFFTLEKAGAWPVEGSPKLY